ncbi:hypothetical protein [Candidatus Methylocalor cossyra]|uniref:Uncharacterized protein n=1 Tax=Candidatus Methylocalor cossyra TaxID=3108543 RepID=A0ABP1CCI7_9GAMM
MPLNPRETALVRGWIEGLPYPVLAQTYLDRDDALAARAEGEVPLIGRLRGAGASLTVAGLHRALIGVIRAAAAARSITGKPCRGTGSDRNPRREATEFEKTPSTTLACSYYLGASL